MAFCRLVKWRLWEWATSLNIRSGLSFSTPCNPPLGGFRRCLFCESFKTRSRIAFRRFVKWRLWEWATTFNSYSALSFCPPCNPPLDGSDIVSHFGHWLAFLFPFSLNSLRGSSVKVGMIQRILAWPLRKDDTHASRSVLIL